MRTRNELFRYAKELKATKATHQSVEEIRNKAMAVQSLKRLPDPKDIVALTVFLASDGAKLISLKRLPIDHDMQQAS